MQLLQAEAGEKKLPPGGINFRTSKVKDFMKGKQMFPFLKLGTYLQIQSSEELACWVLNRVIKFHTC